MGRSTTPVRPRPGLNPRVTVLGLWIAAVVAGSFLGTIAGIIAFVSFGASIDSLSDGAPGFDPTLLVVSVSLTVAGLVVARLLRRRRPDLATDPSAAEVPA